MLGLPLVLIEALCHSPQLKDEARCPDRARAFLFLSVFGWGSLFWSLGVFVMRTSPFVQKKKKQRDFDEVEREEEEEISSARLPLPSLYPLPPFFFLFFFLCLFFYFSCLSLPFFPFFLSCYFLLMPLFLYFSSFPLFLFLPYPFFIFYFSFPFCEGTAMRTRPRWWRMTWQVANLVAAA
jgi:hypothetical protein